MKVNKLIILSCLFSLFSHAKWEELYTPSSENLTCIKFIGNTGFCGGENGELLKSIDAGKTWNTIISGTSDNITSILFLDNNLGFLTTSTGKVIKTSNGGLSWNSTKLQIGAINGIDFLNDSIGLTVGDNGAIFRTSNGGASWSNHGNITVYVMNDITFINDTLAVAVGAQGTVLHSYDVGLTWHLQQINSQNTFKAIEKINDSKAAMVGTSGLYSEFDAVSLLASSPQAIDSDPNPELLMDIHLSSNGNLYVVGFNQTILIANPGWNKWDLDSINDLKSIHFINDTLGFTCGNNGKIYKTTTGGIPLNKENVKFEKLNLYPNPANKKINFSGLKNQENNLIIYDQNGKLITKKKIKKLYYDIENLKNGLYFIQIIGCDKIYRGNFLKY